MRRRSVFALLAFCAAAPLAGCATRIGAPQAGPACAIIAAALSAMPRHNGWAYGARRLAVHTRRPPVYAEMPAAWPVGPSIDLRACPGVPELAAAQSLSLVTAAHPRLWGERMIWLSTPAVSPAGDEALVAASIDPHAEIGGRFPLRLRGGVWTFDEAHADTWVVLPPHER